MTPNQDRLILLELTRADLNYLRNFLYEESLATEIDHENVETLHNDMAIRAAKETLSREHARMTKLVAVIDKTISLVNKHDELIDRVAEITGQPTA